jgi:PAS domain-containing protein
MVENNDSKPKGNAMDINLESTELDHLFDYAPIIMIVVDQDLKIRKVNRAAAIFADRPAEELIGLRPGDAFSCLHSHENYNGCGYGAFCLRCHLRHNMTETFAKGVRFQEEVQFWIEREGKKTESWLLISTAAPMKTKYGELILACWEDITRYKQAQAELAALKEPKTE